MYRTFKFEISILCVLTAGIFLLFFIAPYITESEIPLCLIKFITNYPCPGCGMTRGSVAFWKFDFCEAHYYNLLAIPLNLFALIAIAWIIKDLVQKKHSFKNFLNRTWPWYVYAVLGLIVIWNGYRNIQHGI